MIALLLHRTSISLPFALLFYDCIKFSVVINIFTVVVIENEILIQIAVDRYLFRFSFKLWFPFTLLSCLKLEFTKKQALRPSGRVAFLPLLRSCRRLSGRCVRFRRISSAKARADVIAEVNADFKWAKRFDAISGIL